MNREMYKVQIRANKRILAFLMALFLLARSSTLICFASEDAEQKVGSLYALSAVLMDGESGRVLLEKEGDVLRPMASTTKIMTCILTLELGNMDDVVRVSKVAAAQPKVHLGMQENEQYFLEDLLYSLMLESHNDSAVAIAEHIAGSVEAFADLMNEKAREIGCQNTHFVTPNGLDDADEYGAHSTTAEDLARIMSYCAWKSKKSEKFLEITKKRNYTVQEITGKRTVSCTNHNQLLDMIDGAISGKTGFTGEAGYCYVGAIERDGKKLVVALLGCGWPSHKNYKWIDAKKLLEYGIEFTEQQSFWADLAEKRRVVEEGIPKSGDLFTTTYVEVEVDQSEKMEMLILKGDDLSAETTWKEDLKAPIKKGEVVGTVAYFVNQCEVAHYNVVATENVEKINYLWIFSCLYNNYMMLKNIN